MQGIAATSVSPTQRCRCLTLWQVREYGLFTSAVNSPRPSWARTASPRLELRGVFDEVARRRRTPARSRARGWPWVTSPRRLLCSRSQRERRSNKIVSVARESCMVSWSVCVVFRGQQPSRECLQVRGCAARVGGAFRSAARAYPGGAGGRRATRAVAARPTSLRRCACAMR